MSIINPTLNLGEEAEFRGYPDYTQLVRVSPGTYDMTMVTNPADQIAPWLIGVTDDGIRFGAAASSVADTAVDFGGSLE